VKVLLLILVSLIFFFPPKSFSYSGSSAKRHNVSKELDRIEKIIKLKREALLKIQQHNKKEERLYEKRFFSDKNNYRLLPSGLQKKDENIFLELFGQQAHIAFGFQRGYIKGHSTYLITFSGGASELEFPLDTHLLGVNCFLYYRNNSQVISSERDRYRARFTISWFKDIAHSGKLKDSDWIDGDGHPGKDIYSESSSGIDLSILDLNYIYNVLFYKHVTIGWIAGYKYYKYRYDIYDTDQKGYGPYHPTYTIYVPGPTLLYSVRYRFFYFGINSDIYLKDNFLLNFQFGYSPWVRSNDRDDHILRYKLSEAEGKGDAYFFNVNGIWNIISHWHCRFGFEYAKIDTEGTQHQYFYAGPYMGLSTDVDDKITSSYWLIFLSLNYLI